MEKILNLGSHYVSDFLKSDEEPKYDKYSLDLYLDKDLCAARLKELAPSESMWGKYWYRSGINNSMITELKNIADQITQRMKVQEGDVWLDIACNDGTLLSKIPDTFEKIGIDPCDESFYELSSQHGTIEIGRAHV